MFLPDSPVKSKFTSEKEKYIAIDRLRGDQVGIENKVWKWEQFREALLDAKTWIMFALNIFINVPNGGLGNVSLSSAQLRHAGLTWSLSSPLSSSTDSGIAPASQACCS